MGTMLGEALRSAYGPFEDLARKLAGRNGEVWYEALKHFLRKEEVWVKPPKKQHLEYRDSISITGQNPFVAKDHFKEDTSSTAPVRIRKIGTNFQEHFLDKVEEGSDTADLKIQEYQFYRSDWSYFSDILTELGKNCEIKLSHLWEMLCLQRNGEEGKLSHSNWNIAFIKDKSDILWVVGARWCEYQRCQSQLATSYSESLPTNTIWEIEAFHIGQEIPGSYLRCVVSRI